MRNDKACPYKQTLCSYRCALNWLAFVFRKEVTCVWIPLT